MERELEDLAFVSVALMSIVLACLLLAAGYFANLISKLNCSDKAKDAKMFLVFFYVFLIFVWLFPAITNASPYVLGNYNVSCSKVEDSCVVRFKYLPIKIKEFKLSEIKSIVSYTYEHKYYAPIRASINANRARNHSIEGIFLSKGGRYNRILATGLIANSARDENFKKFADFLQNDEQELNYTNNNHFEKYMWFKYLLLFLGTGFFALKGRIWKWKKDEDAELLFRKKHYFIINAVILYSIFAFLMTIF